MKAINDTTLSQNTPISSDDPIGYVYSENGVKHGAINDRSIEDGTPIYAHPSRPEPERKPLSRDAVIREFEKRPMPDRYLDAFLDGVRWAEKMQGIEAENTEAALAKARGEA